MDDETAGNAVLLNAVRQLAGEARQAAAVLPIDSPDHEFYAGVQYAAERRLRPGLAAIEPHDLDLRSRPYRDGYVSASTLIGLAAASTNSLHIPLPRPASTGLQ